MRRIIKTTNKQKGKRGQEKENNVIFDSETQGLIQEQ